VRLRFVRRIIFAALIYTCAISSARSQSVSIQVSDYHERPIPGTILSGKAPGTSTSRPTDLAGKTQIIAPPGAQPGDPLPLTLVKAPNPNMVIMSPFEGRATIPKSPWFIEVILGEPGNTWALKDERVVSTWAATLIEAYKESHVQVDQSPQPPPPVLTPEASRRLVAAAAGFTPEQIDHAIHSMYNDTENATRRALAREYLRDYHPDKYDKSDKSPVRPPQ
jgi:hypothetical protein